MKCEKCGGMTMPVDADNAKWEMCFECDEVVVSELDGQPPCRECGSTTVIMIQWPGLVEGVGDRKACTDCALPVG